MREPTRYREPPVEVARQRGPGARAQAHHGSRPVRKSCSGHGDTAMSPFSKTDVCASASDKGAGPRTTLPFSSYCDPWQGQQNLLAERTHGTTHPKWVQVALIAKSLMPSGV